MPKPGVKVEISADDLATAALKRVNDRLERMQAPAKRAQEQLSRFGNLTGLNRLSDGLGAVRRGAVSTLHALGDILPVMGALTGAASLAGIYRLSSAWASVGSKLGFSAQRIGLSAGQLQSFQGAARLAGSSAESLQSGMQTLGQGMWDAIGGRNPELMAAFQTLHIGFQNADGSAKSVSTVLPQVADKIARLKNPFAQAAVATAFFGGAAEDLLPFLRLGSKGMAEYEGMARRYGVINDAGAAAANRLRMSQTQLSLAVEGFGYRIAQKLEPVLSPMLARFADWIATSPVLQHWVDLLGQGVQRLGNWLQGIDWKAVGSGADALWHRLQGGIDKLGGLKSAAETFLGLWTAAKLAPMALAVGSSGPIGLLLVAMGAIALATERTRDAWADYQARKQANTDPASAKTAARLAAMGKPFVPAGAQTGGLQVTGGNAASAALFQGIEAQHGLPAGILDRLWANESSRGRKMLSPAGAQGHFGFMPATAAQYGVSDPNDLKQSATGAGAYLDVLRRRYGGDTRKAVAAYNWGLGNVDDDIKRNGADWFTHAPAETRGEVSYVAGGDSSGFSPQNDPNGFWNRAKRDLGFGGGPAATVPPGSAQGNGLQSTIDALRLKIEIDHKNPTPGTSLRVASNDSRVQVDRVSQQRAMDPAMTPGGF